MYIHKLGNTTNGSGFRTSKGLSKNHRIAKNHKRLMGSGLVPEIYEDGKVQRKSDLLRNLKISQPKVPKKYISFDF
jgi:hypothetical protein